MPGALTGSGRPNTMFVVRDLQIFFTTRHMALRDALDKITRDSVLTGIEESWSALQVYGYEHPRLAVTALNPHGGEGGNFGTEEIEHIAPACEDARAAGMPVVGPVPADSVFHQGIEGRFDGVLSHFHDQGHIAAKTSDMGSHPPHRHVVDTDGTVDNFGLFACRAGGCARRARTPETLVMMSDIGITLTQMLRSLRRWSIVRLG
jgi:hypothetical protein